MTICQCTADICVSHGFLLCEKFQCLNKIQVASYTEVIHKKLVFSFLTTSNYTWLRSAQSSTWFVIFHRICLPYDYAATILTRLGFYPHHVVWDLLLPPNAFLFLTAGRVRHSLPQCLIEKLLRSRKMKQMSSRFH